MDEQRQIERDSAAGRSPRKNRGKTARPEEEEEGFPALLHGSDPVRIEINRLENQVKDRERELTEAHGEIRALKLTDRAKEKALAEVTEELAKMAERLQISEAAVESKNLETKRIAEEKREALAAQFAAEATLRRVHAAQKNEELPPLEAILLPLEAEIKRLRQEVAKLQDDNRALERMTKSKEAALLEAEREVHLAKARVAHVDDLQNRNQELVKQNEICQEEYKILDRMHRQKVAEVEKLSRTVRELEEALLSGATAANTARDYQRQLSKVKEEKRTLERTLSRAKVKENRVAAVIAGEWKEAEDKVIPVRQWLEERRVLLVEMQQLRERLSVSEKAARTEAQLKEKLHLRLKVVEDSLKTPSTRSTRSGRRPAANPEPATDADEKPSSESAGDCVSGALYDVLQKEVMYLRRTCQEKDQNLRDREAAVEVLSRKVETMTKAMEVETRKLRREKAALEKEVAAARTEVELEQRSWRSRGGTPRTPRHG